YTTIVGAYASSPAACGTYDQNGNLWEWNEALISTERGMRGGSWFSDASSLPASYRYHSSLFPPTSNNSNVGFRVARPAGPQPVPAVADWTLPVTAVFLLGLSWFVIRRASACIHAKG
ncbi:MAG: SUMF1/EgtB/PvdO family nonheme iron enzyme, partial [Phycisphaerales bacterium]